MNDIGISVSNVIIGTMPEPEYHLEWGEDMPEEVLTGLRQGKVAQLHNANRKPHSIIIMDSYGEIRERLL